MDKIQNQLRAMTIQLQNNKSFTDHSKSSDKIQAGQCIFYVDTFNNEFVIDTTAGIKNPIHINPIEKALSNVYKINDVDVKNLLRTLKGENGIEVNKVIGVEGTWQIKINDNLYAKWNGYDKRITDITEQYRKLDNLKYTNKDKVDNLALESWVKDEIDKIPEMKLSEYRKLNDLSYNGGPKDDSLALQSSINIISFQYRKKSDLKYGDDFLALNSKFSNYRTKEDLEYIHVHWTDTEDYLAVTNITPNSCTILPKTYAWIRLRVSSIADDFLVRIRDLTTDEYEIIGTKDYKVNWNNEGNFTVWYNDGFQEDFEMKWAKLTLKDETYDSLALKSEINELKNVIRTLGGNI